MQDMYATRFAELKKQNSLEWARIFLESKSETERRDALRGINVHGHSEEQKYNRIGLEDSSLLVRDTAVFFLRGGDQKEFVSKLIKVMATDLSPKVRSSAAVSLSSWYTDGGNDVIQDEAPIVQNMELMLTGLSDPETQWFVVNSFGANPSGPKPLTCRMAKEVRGRVRKALEDVAVEASGYVREHINEALKNTRRCKGE